MFNRREAVSRIAMMVGGAFTAPTLFAMDVKESGKFLNADLFSLTDAQRQVVAAVAEHIIPKTNTAGAIDAGVPAFIELMLKDCYKAPEHASFLKGVNDLIKAKFLSQNQDGQVAVLTLLESNTKDLMRNYQQRRMKVGDNVDKETGRPNFLLTSFLKCTSGAVIPIAGWNSPSGNTSNPSAWPEIPANFST